jgi:hypothetical protein
VARHHHAHVDHFEVIALQDALDNLKPCQCCGSNPCLESLDAAKHGDY